MVNKRRRRAIILWVTIVFIVLCQTPNLFFNSPFFHRQLRSGELHRRTKGRDQRGPALPETVVRAHLVLPPGWVGYGAMALREHNAWPALGATAASCLIGALGLMKAYRMTIRFYQGAGGRAEQKPVRPRAPARRGVLLVERRLPWLPDDTAALTLATFRSLLRTPELKMAFIMPVVIGVAMASMRFMHSRRPWSGLPESWMGFAATGMAVLAAFSLAPMMANIFALDRDGFRALVLLPTRRHHILLAKNLACFPFAALVALAMLVGMKFLVGMPWQSFLAALLQAVVAFLLFTPVCNVLSILAPCRLAPGTLQMKKPKAIVFLAVLITMLCLPLIMLPLLIPPGLQLVFSFLNWAPGLPVNLLATLGLLAAAAGFYRLVLPSGGRLLERREQTILREVTEEVE
jgi:ABC-2 type transport system permease protein